MRIAIQLFAAALLIGFMIALKFGYYWFMDGKSFDFVLGCVVGGGFVFCLFMFAYWWEKRSTSVLRSSSDKGLDDRL